LNSRDWSWLILTFSRDAEERYDTNNAHVNKPRKDSRRYLSITNFKRLRYIFLSLEDTIQSCCFLYNYNESVYCRCRVAFHWTMKAARSCIMPLLCIECNIRRFSATKSSMWNKSILFTDWGYGWWLLGQVIEELFDRWAVNWPKVWLSLADWQNDYLTDRLRCQRDDWLTDRQTDWLTDWLTIWLIYMIFDIVTTTDRPIYRLRLEWVNRLTEFQIFWLTDRRLNDPRTDWYILVNWITTLHVILKTTWNWSVGRVWHTVI
jgi:hypothetical protein